MGTRRQFVASALATLPTAAIFSRQVAQAQTTAEHPAQIEYRTSAFDLQTLPLDRLQYMIDADTHFQASAPKEGNVIMSERNGELYDHPVAQAIACMFAINDYLRTDDEQNLTIARDNLDRAFDTSDVVEGASFFPYHFDFALHANPDDTLKAPWYSGMAQGLMLGAASRLYNVKNDESLDPYIESALESFRLFNSQSRPWSPTVDEHKNLWFEEYPADPPGRVLNGHLHAVFGLYDYWLISNDQWAADLICGGIKTVQDRMPDFRHEGSASYYCLAHQVQSPNYHTVHVGQLLTTGDITGEKEFVESALLLAGDYPPQHMMAKSTLPAGHYHIYKAMPEEGGDQEEFDLELDVDTEATFSARQRQLFGEDFYYRVQARNWQNYWIKEGSNGISIPGSLLADPVTSSDVMTHTRGTLLTLPNPYPLRAPLTADLAYPSVEGLPDSENGQVEIPDHKSAEITAQITHDLKILTRVRLDADQEFWVEGTGAEIAGLK